MFFNPLMVFDHFMGLEPPITPITLYCFQTCWVRAVSNKFSLSKRVLAITVLRKGVHYLVTESFIYKFKYTQSFTKATFISFESKYYFDI